MNFKRAILQVLNARQLQWYVDELELSIPRKKRETLLEALVDCPVLSVRKLLEPLYEVDVKRVCSALGISSLGRRKTLIERLLAAAERPVETLPLAQVRQKNDSFVAIDFETADYGRDSACAVAMVRVEDGRIASKAIRLIRPPRRGFSFTHIHGITWSQVKNEPTFAEVWREVRPLLDGARFLAAHNASFDRGVLTACCHAANLKVPDLPFECTVKLARRKWNLYPTKLPNVCTHLGIPLKHHDAGSDAEACARIVLAARG